MRAALKALILLLCLCSACTATPSGGLDALGVGNGTQVLPPEQQFQPDAGVCVPFDAGATLSVDAGIPLPDAGPPCGFLQDAGSVPPDPEPLVATSSLPAPISGGTLIVTKDGRTAVMSDSDRNQVVLIDIAQQALLGTVALAFGDEPGRLAEDGSGRIHVLLRKGGAVATIDLASRAVSSRTPVCPEPRGVAYDPVNDQVFVACTDGELVTLPAAGGLPTRRLLLSEQDLRDVIVQQPAKGGQPSLLISQFRSARLLSVDASGNITGSGQTPPGTNAQATPGVGWRSASGPGGSTFMVFQEATTRINLCVPASYGGVGSPSVGAPAVATVAVMQGGNGASYSISGIVLPVDLAVSADGTQLAVAGAGSDVVVTSTVTLAAGCGTGPAGLPCVNPATSSYTMREPVAVAFDPGGQLLVQTREPALHFIASGVVVPLPGDPIEHTGHRLFHHDSGQGIACASCHPEGREDGRVWDFSPTGPRRTMSVSGGILSRAPYHWNGDEANLGAVMQDVFIERMGGGLTSDAQNVLLGSWLDALPSPAPPPMADPAAVARGRATFADPCVGCASCHSGPLFTNDALFDVGTGGTFKVPSLRGLWARPPYLHAGCASTLEDRFGQCGTPQHGNTATLGPDRTADLIAYLRSL
jgi:hypothetical protein